jgi:ABC-2 type transport system permease protein
MSNALIVVFKREYLKLVKSKAFWATTFLMPLLIGVISLVSGVSSQTMEDKFKAEAENAKAIYVLDETKLIPESFYIGNIKKTDNINFALQEVKSQHADGFIYYSSDLLKNNTIKIYSLDKGIISLNVYDEFAKNFIKQAILTSVDDPEKIALYNANLIIESKLFKDGEETSSGYEKLIIPIGSVILYFLFVSLSTSYLLMSVSEEKENRMIEIILSSIKPKDLILGKILGQVSAILTQIIVLIVLLIIAINLTKLNLPIDFSKIEINFFQILLNFAYLLLGIIMLAITMVGVGAAMPTYREASGFASIFIILSIFPIYFFPIILVDPTGTIAQIVSYFPFTAPMILMLRNALGAITPIEIFLSFLTLVLSIYLLSKISYKLFEFGSLEYNQKISFKNFLETFKKKK